MPDKIKTCLWCTKSCEYYHKFVQPKCNELLGNEASNLRQATAWGCENYTMKAGGDINALKESNQRPN